MRVAVEHMWYVHPSHRKGRLGLELQQAYEYWAQHVAKADAVQMGLLTNLVPDKVAKYYTRKGYNEMERVFIKCYSVDS